MSTLGALRHYESLDQLVERVVRDDARKRDLVSDTRRISVDPDDTGRLLVDGEQGTNAFALSDHALGQIATDLKIPKKYFDRMRSDAPELFRSNVHHWLYQEPTRRMIRGYEVEGDTFQGRAWLSDRYRRLDHIEIARTLLPEFETLDDDVGGVEFHNAAVTEQRLYLRATFPAMEAEVKVGEPVRWGVEIRNSEIGAGLFAISSFMLTLSCLNGMVAYKELAARHVGRRLDDEDIFAEETIQADDTAFWLAARDTLRASINEARFEEAVATLKAAADSEPVVRPLKASEQLAQRFALTDEEREAVLVSLYSGGDMTQWGMLSAVTSAAQTRESFDRRVEMEEVGWQVAELGGKEWATIATA